MLPKKDLEKLVKPIYAKNDPMHNWEHILRIKRKIAILRKQYKRIDEDFLNFMIYFHGIGKWVRKNKKKIKEMRYLVSWIRKRNKPTTPEGKIVWDANLLENVGKFGIRKSLKLEKYYKQSRKETLNLVKKFTKKYRFYTPLGKKLGNKGIEIKKWWLKRELFELKKREQKKRGWIMKILVICLVFHKNKLLILRRKAREAQGGKWDFPGGSLGYSEDIDKGIKREIKEETGISIKNIERLDMIEVRNTRKRYHLLFFYKGRINRKKIKLSDEHDDYKWINPKELFKYQLNWIFPASKKLLLRHL